MALAMALALALALNSMFFFLRNDKYIESFKTYNVSNVDWLLKMIESKKIENIINSHQKRHRCTLHMTKHKASKSFGTCSIPNAAQRLIHSSMKHLVRDLISSSIITSSFLRKLEKRDDDGICEG